MLSRTAKLLLLFLSATLVLPAPGPLVYVIPIDGVIDLGLAPFLARTLREASQARAAAVVLEINTFGGRVDAAVAMRDELLNSPVPTVAFVNQRAISAGALIAMACNTIVMVEGGTIGAAAPVTAGDGDAKPAGEKSVSYLRKEFRATAEVRKRPLEIAEAMVDADVVIPNISEKGKLLTLTTAEALKNKFANHSAPNLTEALSVAGFPNAEIRRVEQTWAEGLVRFLTNPVLSSFLLSIGLLGLLVEIRTPGFGVPGIFGLMAIGLFFYGHWLVRLAGWEELLLISLGILLIGLEVFVLPGTTIAGIGGVIALAAGLGMSLIGAGANVADFVGALGRISISLLLAMVGAFVFMRLLPHIPFGRHMILATGMNAELGYVSAPESDRQWLGRTGTAHSPMRPAGIADIDGSRVDVVADGEFIDAGTPIRVVRVEGNRIVIRPLAAKQENRNG